MKTKPVIYHIIKLLATLWGKCFYPMEVQGKQHLPQDGPVILLPKHQYWTDIPLLGLAFRNIYLYYIAKEELFRFAPIRIFLTSLGGISIDRKRPIKSLESFRYLFHLLRKNEKIVIFPEGTYYRGAMGRGKSGLIRLILKLQQKEYFRHPIPFLPVGIHYQKRGIRKKVTITIGQPLYAEKESDAEEFTKEIIKAIGRLSGLTTDDKG